MPEDLHKQQFDNPHNELLYPFTQRPEVILQPQVHSAFQRGVHQIVRTIAPTFGPLPRTVGHELVNGGAEILDDGGLIARRIIELANRDEDMGAMYLRHIPWRLRTEVGDGTVTAALLFQTIFDEGVRFIAAGGNATMLRQHFETGMRLVLERLDNMITPCQHRNNLSRLALSICHEPRLAQLLGEAFEMLGADGYLDIRSGRGLESTIEYVEGHYWNGTLVSQAMITDHKQQRAEFEDPAILITDLKADEMQELMHICKVALGEGHKSLVLILGDVTEQALGFLQADATRERIPNFAVKVAFDTSDANAAFLTDLALLTGGCPVLGASGQSFNTVRAADFGRARRLWATKDHVGLFGGKGDPKVVRQRLSALRAALKNATKSHQRTAIQERIARLTNGSATLWIGGSTKAEIDARTGMAERVAMVLRGAVSQGIVPGGGVALWSCRPLMAQLRDASQSVEERAAYTILHQAFAQPAHRLLINAGLDRGEATTQLERLPPDTVLDVVGKQVVGWRRAGIYDGAAVVKEAVRAAISSAALALTIDVLVHVKKPRKAYDGP